MFIYTKKHRARIRNLHAAWLLSFVAGFVNVTGLFLFRKLTTHVTGHFAFLVDEAFRLEWTNAAFIVAYILTFLFGAFTANSLISWHKFKQDKQPYLSSLLLEMSLLLLMAIFGKQLSALGYNNLMVMTLLFSMGLQNALITKVSQAAVRTTHLTGLFTDLGIEISQLLFPQTASYRQQLVQTIQLRVVIVFFFLLGGLIAGLAHQLLLFTALLIPAAFLCIAAGVDFLELRLKKRGPFPPKKPQD